MKSNACVKLTVMEQTAKHKPPTILLYPLLKDLNNGCLGVNTKALVTEWGTVYPEKLKISSVI